MAWIEWHLTARGWESGSGGHDTGTVVEVPTPPDTVMTMKVEDGVASEKWRSDDVAAVDNLLGRFGPVPGVLPNK